jgi:NAD(P)-dependent dehydrogenase (short-subunit alcohol dehydrogenase family)
MERSIAVSAGGPSPHGGGDVLRQHFDQRARAHQVPRPTHRRLEAQAGQARSLAGVRAVDDHRRLHRQQPPRAALLVFPARALRAEARRTAGASFNVSSGLARFKFPGYSAYAAMKGGIEVLTRYMAKELGPRRIAVNTIAPGAIETDFGGGRVRDDQQLNGQVAGLTALGRVGLPEDIGCAVAALLSEDSRWITGQRVEVSGGMML